MGNDRKVANMHGCCLSFSSVYYLYMKHKNTIIFGIALVAIFGAIFGTRAWQESQPGQYDEFAQHLKDSGAVFYGASWCPHCAEQKALFGNSYKLLPYKECSVGATAATGQTQECKDAGITGYPTWRFADGSELSGQQSLQVLAEKTGYVLEGTTPSDEGSLEADNATEEATTSVIIE